MNIKLGSTRWYAQIIAFNINAEKNEQQLRDYLHAQIWREFAYLYHKNEKEKESENQYNAYMPEREWQRCEKSNRENRDE